MVKDIFDVISAAQRETASAALTAALGTSPIDAITPVIGGVSGASVFQVVACGRRYVLRIEGRASPLRNPQQYASMRIAAEAGIAPRLHYVDEEARVVVMDFIAEQPLKAYPGGPRALAQTLGETARRLQATPPFPRFMQYPDIVARLWAHVCRTGLFAPGVLDAATQRLAQIREAYVWDPEKSVSSHNDLLPRNLLFDGERLWLIDWESAYGSDPLVDVATALDNFAPSPELEKVLLQAWLGGTMDQKLRDLARADALVLRRCVVQCVGSGAPPDGGYRSFGTNTRRIAAGVARRASRARRARSQTHLGKDVSGIISVWREGSGIATAVQPVSTEA